ncbi:GtrA family protein [Pseudomonas putida]
MNLQRFARYGLVGIGNTLAHWLVFLCLHLLAGLNQASSNVLAFIAAASLSYFLNARYTFAIPPTGQRYLLFLLGMGALGLAVGALADWLGLAPWKTLVAFSTLSLIVGYAYSRAVVFKPGTC